MTDSDAMIFVRHHPNHRGALLASDIPFVGKPKSMVENSRGQFLVTDGLDVSDKVEDSLRQLQGIHVFELYDLHQVLHDLGVDDHGWRRRRSGD